MDPATLTKSTNTYAKHKIPLDCDVYQASDYPDDSPVFLFFHSGGLVTGSRADVHPWLAQVCMKRKWPLVSASYRFLPQADGQAIVEDGKAAYEFARTLNNPERKVIIGGASAGFFVATVATHYSDTKPLALLSICGLPTFRHQFYRSSSTIPECPILQKDDVERLSAGPTTAETISPSVFDVDMLSPFGAKNSDCKKPAKPAPEGTNREYLYAYYLYTNAFETLVGSVDYGFDWAKDPKQANRLAEWPTTIFIQGDADIAVDMDVCASAARALGSEKAKFCLAKGQGHLYQRENFIEDEDPGMDAVREAVEALYEAVSASLTGDHGSK